MKPILLHAPTSKSMTQRALVLAALADGPSTVARPLVCDDARHLSRLLEAMGVGVERGETAWRITPAALRAPAEPQVLGNAGTAVRFGSCLSLLSDGPLTIDGDEHMRRRPLGPLVDALAQLGVEARYLGAEGCPPVRLERTSPTPPAVTIDGSLSSQYASGLAMVGPRLPRGLTVHLEGELVSQPYLDMTLAMMRRAGIEVAREGRAIAVPPGTYRGGTFEVEVDWSGAAFLLAAGFVLDRTVEVPGLASPADSLQGDAVFADFLTRLRSNEPSTFDLTEAPDLIAPLAAAALFASHPTTIVGAAHTRVKESDRVAVLASQLSKVGANIEVRADGLQIQPLATPIPGPRLDPHDDHRMAMAFAVVGLRVPLSIDNPACVSKSFPDFFAALAPLQETSR